MPELQEVSIKDAKNNLTSLISHANETGTPFIVTKRGKPTAKVLPVETQQANQNEKLNALEAFFKKVESYGLVMEVPISPADDKRLLGKIREERFV